MGSVSYDPCENLFCSESFFPKRKSHSEQALADLYKDATEGNMTSNEIDKVFDQGDEKHLVKDKEWKG